MDYYQCCSLIVYFLCHYSTLRWKPYLYILSIDLCITALYTLSQLLKNTQNFNEQQYFLNPLPVQEYSLQKYSFCVGQFTLTNWNRGSEYFTFFFARKYVSWLSTCRIMAYSRHFPNDNNKRELRSLLPMIDNHCNFKWQFS